MSETRSRILGVALQVLADDPDAGMGDIARAAGVVRRTVYGHFPSRWDLVRSLVELAVSEVQGALDGARAVGGADAAERGAPQVWADFVSRLWLLAHRYRVLVALRRGEYGGEIHALLKPVDDGIMELVRQGQEARSFGSHLPCDILGQVALSAVFNVFDSGSADRSISAREAIVTSLLILGVPAETASELADGR